MTKLASWEKTTKCGLPGTWPGDCVSGHKCCAIHAVENAGMPCIACHAQRKINAKARREGK